MSGPEQPFDLRTAIRGLSKPQLEGFIANAKVYLAQPDQPTSPSVVSPSPPEHPAPRKGFVEEIDDLLASGEGPTRKIPVTLQRLARHLQTLPLPQDASLQNLNIEILDGRSVRAQGKISKAGTSDFVVMLGADQDGGELKVVSTGLTNVALTHQGQTGNITQHLGDLIPTLQKQLDSQIADKTWHATGFSVSPDHKELVVNFENGKMEKAREDLAEVGIKSLKRLITRFNLERPKLSDLARPALQDQGTQEQLDNFAPKWVRWLANQIEKGRVRPDEAATRELFALLHEDDAQAIKVMIGEKLAVAGDTPWASAWRNYLTPPPATEEARPSPEQLAGAEAVIAELMKGGKTREEAIAYLEDLDRRNREQAES